MSVSAQNLLTISLHRNHLKSPLSNLSFSSRCSFHSRDLDILRRGRFDLIRTARFRINAFNPQMNGSVFSSKEGAQKALNFDAFLSMAEGLCIAPSVAFSIGCVVNSLVSGSQKPLQVSLLNKFFVWQFFLLVGAVGIGALIRQRQWQRICSDSGSTVASINLVERIEKLEEDLKSSATIIRVLSRQLEKLGIRFRVTRKALKEPISETAVLAQKNSEATRALAMQEEILEKELGEIQKVLLAMQEQQQKQFELIIAIGKAGKLREGKREPVAEEVKPFPEAKEVLSKQRKETLLYFTRFYPNRERRLLTVN